MKKFRSKTLSGKVVSVHSGNNEDLSKDTRGSLTAEIGGFAGDKHHGLTRKAWKVDWQPAGTVRRNERQWSGVSVERTRSHCRPPDAYSAAGTGHARRQPVC